MYCNFYCSYFKSFSIFLFQTLILLQNHLYISSRSTMCKYLFHEVFHLNIPLNKHLLKQIYLVLFHLSIPFSKFLRTYLHLDTHALQSHLLLNDTTHQQMNLHLFLTTIHAHVSILFTIPHRIFPRCSMYIHLFHELFHVCNDRSICFHFNIIHNLSLTFDLRPNDLHITFH